MTVDEFKEKLDALVQEARDNGVEEDDLYEALTGFTDNMALDAIIGPSA